MAIKEEFEIFISKDGEMRVVAKGYTGNECMQPLKNIQKTLNAEETEIHSHVEGRRSVDTSVDAKVRKKK